MLERFRQVGLRLDRAGQLWHEGEVIRHRGLQQALLRWLDRLDDGRDIVRLDEQRYAYIDVEDAHLLVLSLRWEGESARIRLNDGNDEELAYPSLQVGQGEAMYCAVRGGTLIARLTPAAQAKLAERVESVAGDIGLRAGGGFFIIGERKR